MKKILLAIALIAVTLILAISCSPHKDVYEVTYVVYYVPEKPDTFKISVYASGPGHAPETYYGEETVTIYDSIGKFEIGDAVRFQLIRQ